MAACTSTSPLDTSSSLLSTAESFHLKIRLLKLENVTLHGLKRLLDRTSGPTSGCPERFLVPEQQRLTPSAPPEPYAIGSKLR